MTCVIAVLLHRVGALWCCVDAHFAMATRVMQGFNKNEITHWTFHVAAGVDGVYTILEWVDCMCATVCVAVEKKALFITIFLGCWPLLMNGLSGFLT